MVVVPRVHPVAKEVQDLVAECFQPIAGRRELDDYGVELWPNDALNPTYVPGTARR